MSERILSDVVLAARVKLNLVSNGAQTILTTVFAIESKYKPGDGDMDSFHTHTH